MNDILDKLKAVKISTIAVSGGGKTVYTYGIFKQFYGGAHQNGFHLKDAKYPHIPNGYNYKKLSGITQDVLNPSGPHGTGTTTIMDLELCKPSKFLSIEWMDYPGGLLDKFAVHDITKDNIDLYDNLINSHVLIVFTDASLLKHLLITQKTPDINTIRQEMRADKISLLLDDIVEQNATKKQKTRIMFVLTKYDAANIDQSKDKDVLIKAVEDLYYLAWRKNVQYKIYPVGVYGIGNTTTSIIDDVLINTCKDSRQMLGYNVVSSFAQALCMAIETAIEKNEAEWEKTAEENNKARSTFRGKLKMLMTIIVCIITRTTVTDPEEIQRERLNRIEELKRYKDELKKLAEPT